MSECKYPRQAPYGKDAHLRMSLRCRKVVVNLGGVRHSLQMLANVCKGSSDQICCPLLPKAKHHRGSNIKGVALSVEMACASSRDYISAKLENVQTISREAPCYPSCKKLQIIYIVIISDLGPPYGYRRLKILQSRVWLKEEYHTLMYLKDQRYYAFYMLVRHTTGHREYSSIMGLGNAGLVIVLYAEVMQKDGLTFLRQQLWLLRWLVGLLSTNPPYHCPR